jgi:hypothetical protein
MASQPCNPMGLRLPTRPAGKRLSVRSQVDTIRLLKYTAKYWIQNIESLFGGFSVVGEANRARAVIPGKPRLQRWGFDRDVSPGFGLLQPGWIRGRGAFTREVALPQNDPCNADRREEKW